MIKLRITCWIKCVTQGNKWYESQGQKFNSQEHTQLTIGIVDFEAIVMGQSHIEQGLIPTEALIHVTM